MTVQISVSWLRAEAKGLDFEICMCSIGLAQIRMNLVPDAIDGLLGEVVK